MEDGDMTDKAKGTNDGGHYEPGVIIVEGDLVVAHGRYSSGGSCRPFSNCRSVGIVPNANLLPQHYLATARGLRSCPDARRWTPVGDHQDRGDVRRPDRDAAADVDVAARRGCAVRCRGGPYPSRPIQRSHGPRRSVRVTYSPASLYLIQLLRVKEPSVAVGSLNGTSSRSRKSDWDATTALRETVEAIWKVVEQAPSYDTCGPLARRELVRRGTRALSAVIRRGIASGTFRPRCTAWAIRRLPFAIVAGGCVHWVFGLTPGPSLRAATAVAGVLEVLCPTPRGADAGRIEERPPHVRPDLSGMSARNGARPRSTVPTWRLFHERSLEPA